MDAERYFELCELEGEEKAVMEALASPVTPETAGVLGYIHYLGEGGIEPDNEKAFEYLMMGEKADDSLSLYFLGLMCYEGELPERGTGGTEQLFDWYDSERFMERCAATEGMMQEQALVWLGDFYMDFARGGDPDIAIEYYEKAAGMGSIEAMDKIATYYYDMAGSREYRDEELNTALFGAMTRLHAASPSTENYNLGYLYENGIGTPKDMDKAAELYEADYREGFADGAQALADYYSLLAETAGEEDASRLRELAEMWQKRADEAERLRPEAPETEED